MNLDDGLSETATKWLVRPMIRNKTEQFGRLPIKSRNFLFSGSKYIQSIPSGIISQFDKQDKYLVVGTPCQIAGLVKYIETKRFDRNKFLLVDFHCHGVPSYIVWDKYVEYVKNAWM